MTQTLATPAADWSDPFGTLRRKWGTVPADGGGRVVTNALLSLNDATLLQHWRHTVTQAATGANFAVRGWYHTLYRDLLRGKRVLDVGSGFGIDGLTFALAGAQMTFLDIVPDNLAVLRRLAKLLGVNCSFVYLESLASLDTLAGPFDVIWAQGSMINAPFDFMRQECALLLRRLPVGGRWVELAYPQERWRREGELPFERWGRKTDGVGTPWVEWYDLAKLRARLAPAAFEPVLAFNFHADDFNWFDLVRTG